jgi:hypothetical protein
MEAGVCHAMSSWLRWQWVVAGSVVSLSCGFVYGQQQDRHAVEIVRVATATELKADKEDHSLWTFRDVDRNHEGEHVSMVVETRTGSVDKKIEANGHRLGEDALKREDARIDEFVHSPAQQAKKRRDNEQDDRRAESLLKMLPEAFLWTVKSDSGDVIVLGYVPNPAFTPPTLESRVFAAMAGEIVVNKAQNRIQTIKGELTEDVKFGWGLFGKMDKGGTFDVERRELSPGIWQITESHVHIGGHALLFKSIGEQDDEVKSGYKRTPAEMTLEGAAEFLKGQPQALSAQR